MLKWAELPRIQTFKKLSKKNGYICFTFLALLYSNLIQNSLFNLKDIYQKYCEALNIGRPLPIEVLENKKGNETISLKILKFALIYLL